MSGSDEKNLAVHLAAIRDLNDAFRKNLSGGPLLLSSGVIAHAKGNVRALTSAIAAFNEFTDDNDPYGEHDFGCLSYMGHQVFWKIDYYDRHLTHGSPNAADPDVTTRVLTIMMAWEY